MPRARRACFSDRHQQERRRRRQEAGVQNINDVPANAAVHQFPELQFQHAVAVDPELQGADQAMPSEDHQIVHELQVDLPAPHHLGTMNNRCPHCEAKYFQEEYTTQHIFTKRCFQGKVRLPPLQPPPQAILELFNGDTAQSPHFLENIRNYNAALSMAFWNAKLREPPSRGPRVVTIHGQPYHLTAAQKPQKVNLLNIHSFTY